jgi:hypothetical protein
MDSRPPTPPILPHTPVRVSQSDDIEKAPASDAKSLHGSGSSVSALDDEERAKLERLGLVEGAAGGVKRNLKERHIALIALGGTIGTGLFVGLGASLAASGPLSTLLGYTLMGFLVWALMVALGELATFLPLPGGFVAHASRFVSPGFGAALGWQYWVSTRSASCGMVCADASHSSPTRSACPPASLRRRSSSPSGTRTRSCTRPSGLCVTRVAKRCASADPFFSPSSLCSSSASTSSACASLASSRASWPASRSVSVAARRSSHTRLTRPSRHHHLDHHDARHRPRRRPERRVHRRQVLARAGPHGAVPLGAGRRRRAERRHQRQLGPLPRLLERARLGQLCLFGHGAHRHGRRRGGEPAQG